MSGHLPKHLRLLDSFLAGGAVPDDCMMLSELDGFLAGILVCPDLILPSEWMPYIWGEGEPVFETLEQVEAVNGAIMRHYNDILRQLDRGGFTPIYDTDTRSDEVLWEPWIEGFHQALTLRPEAWLDIEEDGKANGALSALLDLQLMATPPGGRPMDGRRLDRAAEEELMELAPGLIPYAVQILHDDRKARAGAPLNPANWNAGKIGRNDPCPCGSGKKFKKCCLN